MSSSIQKMPTLGHFNKVVCDSLGLWASENKNIVFNVPAKEKERRKALSEAFSAIKRKDGSYGDLDDLISVTMKTSPQQREEVKKNKTIQNYTNHLSKEDFFSYGEFVEFKEYIDIVIDDRFPQKGLSTFASKFYSSSLMYYREFIREHAAKPEDQLDSYLYFMKHILINLIESLVHETSISAKVIISSDKNNRWPLRSFVDSVADLCGVSLHELHQFHELRLNANFCDKDIWSLDFKSQPVNTKSKQVIDRLSKNNKIKWGTFYYTIKPFVSRLPEGEDEELFWIKAYSVFITHNITNHIFEMDLAGTRSIPESLEWQSPVLHNKGSQFPVSDRVDLLFNEDKLTDELFVQKSMGSYHDLIKRLRLLSSSLIKDLDTPSTLDFLYSKKDIDFSAIVLQRKFDKTPLWLDEWILAKVAVSLGNAALALKHYKRSLEEAKYLAGPLFFPLYVEICALCKHQYKELRKTNEEDLFDRFYEPLGEAATKYAALLGYTSGFSRDPETLMPKLFAPKKNALLIKKIDKMAGLLSLYCHS